MIDEQRPWDRQPGEPNLWYSRFERLRLMGPTRTLLGCVNAERAERGGKRAKRVPGAWYRATERWHWTERVEAWDQAERDRLTAEQEAERERAALEWQERQRLIRQADYAVGQRLRDLAAKILDEGPKFISATRKRVSKGRPAKVDATGNLLDPGEPEQIVVTLALNADLAIKAVDAASKLERQAAEMAPVKQAVQLSGEDGGPLVIRVDYGDDKPEPA